MNVGPGAGMHVVDDGVVDVVELLLGVEDGLDVVVLVDVDVVFAVVLDVGVATELLEAGVLDAATDDDFDDEVLCAFVEVVRVTTELEVLRALVEAVEVVEG